MSRLVVKDGKIVYEDTGTPIPQRGQPRPTISAASVREIIHRQWESTIHTNAVTFAVNAAFVVLREAGVTVEGAAQQDAGREG